MDILDYFFFNTPIPVDLLTTPQVQAPVSSTTVSKPSAVASSLTPDTSK